MDLAVAKELRVGEPRDHSKNALLLGNPQSGLKADKVPHRAGAILLAELYHGPWATAGAGIVEANGFHGTESERLAATLGHDLDRHASLEIRHLVEVVRAILVAGGHRVEERLVFLARHRAVQVRAFVAGAFHGLLAITRRAEDDVVVDGLERDDGCNRVIER